MKSSHLAWLVGAVTSMGLGMAAEACSSSSSVGTTSSSASSKSVSSNHSSSAATSGSSGAGASSSSSVECYTAPKAVYPEDGGSGLYCPFSSTTDGGHNIVCPIGQHCCEPPAKDVGIASTCEPAATACGTDYTDWQCEGTPDCVNSNHPGTICCGQGKILPQGAQPGCGPDGSTIPSFPYASEFYGSQCQTSCATFNGTDAGAFQVCSKDSECTAPEVCIPIKPKGNAIGYCGLGDGGAGSSSASSSAGSESSAASSASATSAASSSAHSSVSASSTGG